MSKPRIYIAGPISGMPNDNIEAFAEAAATLRAKGYDAINPHELHEGATDRTWEGYMCRDLPHVLASQVVATLPGWENSDGAQIEVFIAHRRKKFVVSYALLKTIEPQHLESLIYTNKMAPVCNQ